jgi:hypothetical protein
MQQRVIRGRDSRRRREAARERFLREIQELPIYVPCVPLADLEPAAIDCRNRFVEHRDGRARPITRADRDTVVRLIVNYLKHQVTSYEDLIEQAHQYRLGEDAYARLRDRVLDAIAAAYPELAGECQRQREKS